MVVAEVQVEGGNTTGIGCVVLQGRGKDGGFDWSLTGVKG